ncbi:MAG TPA: hypothetical protein PKY59_24550, partial [Pyrinomonadaceae bacterium]|nr:hypothetical protein [Pyrinomonadaceae bacterium]
EFEANPNKIKYWLIWLARLMEKKHLVNFELADLQPTDLIKRWHYNLVFGLLIGLIVSLVFGIFFNLVFGLISALIGVLLGSLITKIFDDYKVINTEDNLSFNIRSNFFNKGSLMGLLFGLITGLLIILIVGAVGGLIGGLIIGLFSSIYFGSYLMQEIEPIVYIQHPYQRISSGILFNLFKTILLVLGILLTTYSINFLGLENFFVSMKLQDFLKCIYLSSLSPIFVFLVRPVFLHSYLRLCLWFEGSMPLKYAAFLDLAAEARILEKDGGQWRFRHQNLQEYFAKLETGE